MKLCPELKIVPLRYDRYRQMSAKVVDILSRYDSNLSMWSLDEAFLKLKKGEKSDNDEFVEIVQKMRDEVKERTGLTCSAGIACNPLLAKMASNYRKPDGQFEIERKDLKKMREFLFDQPVRKISGIGKVMTLTLEKVFGITKIGELYEKRHLLPLVFKEKTVKSLVSKSIGHSSAAEDTEIVGESFAEQGQKSVSCERTFQSKNVDYDELLREICENLGEDVKLMRISEIGRVGIKVKTADFRVFTREKSCKITTDMMDVVGSIARDLLKEFIDEYEMRLMGVKLSNLKYADEVSRKRTALEEWLEAESSGVKCPICTKSFRNANDLNEINGHVDECLTKSALKDIL